MPGLHQRANGSHEQGLHRIYKMTSKSTLPEFSQCTSLQSNLSQVDNSVLEALIQVHMATNLVDGLAGVWGVMHMESPARTLLHQFQTPWGA